MTDILTLAPSVGVFAGDPNGVVTAAKSAILRDSTNAKLWINTTGSTVWSAFGTSTPNVFDLGDGSDGACVLDGTNTFPWATKVGSVYKMTRPFFASAVTVALTVTLQPDGWSGRCTGVFTNNGDVTVRGNDASGVTPGDVTWVAASRELPAGVAGGSPPAAAGGSSARAPQVFSTTAVPGGTAGLGGGVPTAGGTGGVGGTGHGGGGGGGGGALGGGNGAAGGAGGTVSSIESSTAGAGDVRQYGPAVSGRNLVGQQFSAGSGGGSGSNASGGGGAAAGGGGGGWMMFAASSFAGTGTWTVSGGNGGGATSTSAGGGGGGGGGIAVFHAFTGAYPAAVLTGGVGGAGSAGVVGVLAGGNGGNGGVGYQVNL